MGRYKTDHDLKFTILGGFQWVKESTITDKETGKKATVWVNEDKSYKEADKKAFDRLQDK